MKIGDKRINSLNRQAEGVLLNHAWTGNVRELKNLIEKMIIFSKSSEITLKDVQNAFGIEQLTSNINIFEKELTSLKTSKLEFERNYIIKVLEKNNWKINESANILGVDRTNLYKKMQKYGIHKSKS